jgi:hypothetical protein
MLISFCVSIVINLPATLGEILYILDIAGVNISFQACHNSLRKFLILFFLFLILIIVFSSIYELHSCSPFHHSDKFQIPFSILLHQKCGNHCLITSGLFDGSGLGFHGTGSGGNTVVVILSIVHCCSGVVFSFSKYSSHLALAIS